MELGVGWRQDSRWDGSQLAENPLHSEAGPCRRCLLADAPPLPACLQPSQRTMPWESPSRLVMMRARVALAATLADDRRLPSTFCG